MISEDYGITAIVIRYRWLNYVEEFKKWSLVLRLAAVKNNLY
jgi:hypothetical protein